jgi:hypothetical protein
MISSASTHYGPQLVFSGVGAGFSSPRVDGHSSVFDDFLRAAGLSVYLNNFNSTVSSFLTSTADLISAGLKIEPLGLLGTHGKKMTT